MGWILPGLIKNKVGYGFLKKKPETGPGFIKKPETRPGYIIYKITKLPSYIYIYIYKVKTLNFQFLSSF